MTFNDYQKWTDKMWTPHRDSGLTPTELQDLFLMTAGMGGETGELLEKLKKSVRDGGIDPDLIKKELGDVLYYWCRLAKFFGFTAEEIMADNVDKLESRFLRGKLQGSGDTR